MLMTYMLDISSATAGEVLELNPNALGVNGLPVSKITDANNDILASEFISGFLTITGGEEPGPEPVIPEPSSLVLFALGVVGIAGYNRNRKRQTAA